ncbi:MAG: hypothetical protein AAGA56_26955, partial [Myxococcota bacterium]
TCSRDVLTELTRTLEGSGLCSDGKGVCFDGGPLNTEELVAMSDPVGSHSECATSTDAWPSVLDLSGSASEWTAACEPGSGACAYMGGGLNFRGEDNTCNQFSLRPRDQVNHFLGIRCCADPIGE